MLEYTDGARALPGVQRFRWAGTVLHRGMTQAVVGSDGLADGSLQVLSKVLLIELVQAPVYFVWLNCRKNTLDAFSGDHGEQRVCFRKIRGFCTLPEHTMAELLG